MKTAEIFLGIGDPEIFTDPNIKFNKTSVFLNAETLEELRKALHNHIDSMIDFASSFLK